MALVQRKFTDLPGASALGASDIITIFAKTPDNTSVNYQAITRCRISWTEDQDQ